MLSGTMEQPSPLGVLWSILRVLTVTRRPSPQGSGSVDHDPLASVLESLGDGGLESVAAQVTVLDGYIQAAQGIDPDRLSVPESLAYWLNLYNAGAIRLAVTAAQLEHSSVLRVPGAFGKAFVAVAGENLSLDAIEHGKIRRFGDPRIHGALVCGSVSCPTARSQPYTGVGLSQQLDDQMRGFLGGGGAAGDGEAILLSRVFLWFGADFVRPGRMPTFIPARSRSVLRALQAWVPEDLKGDRQVRFQSYDWGLRCAVS